MTKEDRDLLLTDLCARLPYGVKVQYISKLGEVIVKELRGSDIEVLFDGYHPERYKPYFRPMSSMTEEESIEYYDTFEWEEDLNGGHYPNSMTYKTFEWLNAHHFDYRGLIDKGLAIEAPKGMYK